MILTLLAWSMMGCSGCAPQGTAKPPEAESGVDTAVDTSGDSGAESDSAGPPDVDGDGWSAADGDCDDTRADVNPIATEVCDAVDNTCDGAIDEGVTIEVYADADGFGWGTAEVSCAIGLNQSADATDCDDTDATVYGGAPEVSDCLDNDCDGLVDEDGLVTWWFDADGDGHGDGATAVEACVSPGDGWVENGDDCDDTDPAAWIGAPEPGDGVDNDCDGLIDELPEPDFGDESLAVSSVASDEDGGYVVLGVPSDSSASPAVVDRDSFLTGSWTSGAHWVSDGGGASSSFVADVDGDGHADLFTTYSWADPYPYDSQELSCMPGRMSRAARYRSWTALQGSATSAIANPPECSRFSWRMGRPRSRTMPDQ